MLKINKQSVELLDRLSIVTPTRAFTSIEEAGDFFSSRSITVRQYLGEQLSVVVRNGKIFLLIKGDQETKSFFVRDSGMEGLLMRSGMGVGSFPMTVCDNHLIEYNLNHLFHRIVPSEKFTVILDKSPGEEFPAIKAVMSGVYTHIPHKDVLNIVSDLDIDFKVHSLELTKDFFRINITNPANKIEVKVGDVSSIGVDLLNSETGHASLWMGQFVYRYWCDNGASHIDKNSAIRSRAIHRGNEIHKALIDFRKGAEMYLTQGADILKKNFEIMMGQEVTESFLNKVTAKIEMAVGKKNTFELVDEWEKSTKQKPCEGSEWADRKMVDYDNNRFDFTQLVTRAAHRDFSGEKKLGLEKVGGWLYAKAPAMA